MEADAGKGVSPSTPGQGKAEGKDVSPSAPKAAPKAAADVEPAAPRGKSWLETAKDADKSVPAGKAAAPGRPVAEQVMPWVQERHRSGSATGGGVRTAVRLCRERGGRWAESFVLRCAG